MTRIISNSKYLLKNTSITTVSRGLGIISGFVLDGMVLASFGLGKETDAFFVAIAMPLLICSTFEHQIEKVIVPLSAGNVFAQGREHTQYLLNNFITSFCVILISITLVGMYLSSIIVPLQAPGIQNESVTLSINLSVILFALVAVRGVGAIFQSILYSYHQYMFATGVKIINNTAAIVVLITFKETIGIYALAVGHVSGGIAASAYLLWGLMKVGYKYTFVLKVKDKELFRMYKLLLYPLASHVISDLKVLIENYLASAVGGGAISALRYAAKIVDSLMGVSLGGIVTATLPLISHYAVENNIKEMKESVLEGIKLLVFIALPLCVWLLFTSKLMILMLFERGQFTKDDALLTGMLVSLMTPYLFFGRVSSIIQNIFYAKMDMKTPMLSSIVNIGVSTLLSLVFVQIVGVYIFPVASFIASLCAAIAMLVVMNNNYGSLEWIKLKTFVIKYAKVMLVLSVALLIGLIINKYILGDNVMYKIIRFALPTSIGLVFYIMSLYVFNILNKNNVREFFMNIKGRDNIKSNI